MPVSSLTGINVPESPPTFPEAIAPPFFTASISRASQSGWGKGDIYNAEVDFHQGGYFTADELSGTCDFEDGSFYDLGELCEVAFWVLEDDVSDDAGAGDSDVQ
jgi:hypothetical protein